MKKLSENLANLATTEKKMMNQTTQAKLNEELNEGAETILAFVRSDEAPTTEATQATVIVSAFLGTLAQVSQANSLARIADSLEVIQKREINIEKVTGNLQM